MASSEVTAPYASAFSSLDKFDVKSKVENSGYVHTAVANTPGPESSFNDGFSIRKFVASVRKTDLKKCWPFSERLLQICLKEGRNPPLPPLDVPCDISPVIQTGIRYQNVIGRCLEKGNLEDACLTVSLREHLEGEKENDIMAEEESFKDRSSHSKAFEVSGEVHSNFTSEDSSKAMKSCRQLPPKGNGQGSHLRGCEEQYAYPFGTSLQIQKEAAETVPSVTESKDDQDVSVPELTNGNTTSRQDAEPIPKDVIRRKNPEQLDTCRAGSKTFSQRSHWTEESHVRRVSNDNSNSEEGPGVKTCPVCKIFTSSTINAVNAHMDNCLAQVSNTQPKQERQQNSKWKPQKKRSIVEIFACAPPIQTAAEASEGIHVRNSSSLPLERHEEDEVISQAQNGKKLVNSSATHSAAATDQFVSQDSSSRRKRVRKKPSDDTQSNERDCRAERIARKRKRGTFGIKPVSSSSRFGKDGNAVRKLQRIRPKGPSHGLQLFAKKTKTGKRRRNSNCGTNIGPPKSNMLKTVVARSDCPSAVDVHSLLPNISKTDSNPHGIHGRKEIKRLRDRTKTDELSSVSTVSNAMRDFQVSVQSVHVNSQKRDDHISENCRKHMLEDSLVMLGQHLQSDNRSLEEGAHASPDESPRPVVSAKVNESTNVNKRHATVNAAKLRPDLINEIGNQAPLIEDDEAHEAHRLPANKVDSPEQSDFLKLKNRTGIFPRDSRGRFMSSVKSNKTTFSKPKRKANRKVSCATEYSLDGLSVHKETNFAINAAVSNAAFSKLNVKETSTSCSPEAQRSNSDGDTPIPDLNAAVPQQDSFYAEVMRKSSSQENLTGIPGDVAEATPSQVTKEPVINSLLHKGCTMGPNVGLPLDSQGMLVQRIAECKDPLSSTDSRRVSPFSFDYQRLEKGNLSSSYLVGKSRTENSRNQRVMRLMGKSFVVSTKLQESFPKIHENANDGPIEPEDDEDMRILSETRRCCSPRNLRKNSVHLNSLSAIHSSSQETDLFPCFERNSDNGKNDGTRQTHQTAVFPKQSAYSNEFLGRRSSRIIGRFTQESWTSPAGYSRPGLGLQNPHFVSAIDEGSNPRNSRHVFFQPLDSTQCSSATTACHHYLQVPCHPHGKTSLSSEFPDDFTFNGMHARPTSTSTDNVCEETAILPPCVRKRALHVIPHQKESTTTFVDFFSSASEMLSDSNLPAWRKTTEKDSSHDASGSLVTYATIFDERKGSFGDCEMQSGYDCFFREGVEDVSVMNLTSTNNNFDLDFNSCRFLSSDEICRRMDDQPKKLSGGARHVLKPAFSPQNPSLPIHYVLPSAGEKKKTIW